MQSHPNAKPTFRQGVLCLASSSYGVRRITERHEKGIALRVHFDAAMAVGGASDKGAVLIQLVRIQVRAELMEEPRRAFDVRE
jgi:hypothetical protein